MLQEQKYKGGLPALQLDLEQEIAPAVAQGLVDERPVDLDRGRIGQKSGDIVRQVIAKQRVCAGGIGQEHPEHVFMRPGRHAAACVRPAGIV